MDRIEELRNRPDLIRQLALLAVVVAAGALLLALPQPSGDQVTIAALSDDEGDETTQDEEASGPTAEDSDDGWLARDESSPEPDVNRFAMVAGFGAAANSAADLGATTSSSTSSSSTTSSSTTEPTTTSSTIASSTTAVPTTAAPTTAAPTETVDDTSNEPASEPQSDDVAPDPEVDDPAQVDEPESADTAEQDAPTTTTAPPTTAAPDNGYVDAGHGVMVPPVLLKIRFCESTDNYTAANPASSARGGYQFLTGSWAAYGHATRYGVSQAHLASPAQQDEAALITWQADGTRPWLASKHCWG